MEGIYKHNTKDNRRGAVLVRRAARLAPIVTVFNWRDTPGADLLFMRGIQSLHVKVVINELGYEPL